MVQPFLGCSAYSNGLGMVLMSGSFMNLLTEYSLGFCSEGDSTCC